MANTKINQLPLYTGNTSGSYLVMNNSGETTTYKVTKETLMASDGSKDNLAYFNSSTNQITGSYITHITNGGNTLGIGTDAFNSGAPERLMVDNSSAGSFNIATFQTSKNDSYAQVNIRNFGTGVTSSTDLILWNDVSTESSSYFDIGINSSNFSGDIGYAGDAYIYNAANDLYIGSTDNVTNHGHVHIFGGNHYIRTQLSIYGDRTIGFNVNTGETTTIPSSVSGFTYEFSGSMKLNNDLRVEGKTTNNSYVVLSQVSGSLNFTNDADAATGGVPLGGLYRNGNFIMIRIS
jgi:hypothetical protein